MSMTRGQTKKENPVGFRFSSEIVRVKIADEIIQSMRILFLKSKKVSRPMAKPAHPRAYPTKRRGQWTDSTSPDRAITLPDVFGVTRRRDV